MACRDDEASLDMFIEMAICLDNLIRERRLARLELMQLGSAQMNRAQCTVSVNEGDVRGDAITVVRGNICWHSAHLAGTDDQSTM